MSYTVAVANEKGGVAKTTTALSLGAALAERGEEVLLVDLDPQANLTLSLGIKPNDVSGGASDLLLGDGTLESVRQETRVPGLTLVPANSELLMAERFLSVRQNYETLLGERLNSSGEFNYVLLDCPPALGVTTHSALTAADLLLIPTQAEFFSASALRDVIDLVRDIRAHSNPGLRYRLLLTMLDQRNRIHRTLYEQIRRTFGKAVLETVIEVDTRLRESPIFAKPITEYAPDSRGAAQYRALAEELMAYAKEATRRPS
ncbi:MAG: ParA family protein [Anaerolineales bacterium]